MQQEDIKKAQAVQGKMIANLPQEIPSDKTDKLGSKTGVSGSTGLPTKKKPLIDKGLENYGRQESNL